MGDFKEEVKMVLGEKVKKVLASESRVNVYSTTSKGGLANIAVIGSTTLLEDGTLMAALGDNRTFANLKENPRAACLVKIEGTTGLQMDGCRLYLRVKAIHDGGETFDNFMAKLRAKIGSAAEMLKHVVIFEITGARPVLDRGQGI
jgi:hypothetical protein